MNNSKWCKSQCNRLWMAMESFLFTRKQFCSCVRPVTLIYCVKMVTFFFSFVCQKPKYRMLDYICYSVNFVKLQCTCIVLAPLILSVSYKKCFYSFLLHKESTPHPPFRFLANCCYWSILWSSFISLVNVHFTCLS